MLGDSRLAGQGLALYWERFSETGLYENEVFPGVTAMLRACQDAGFRMFVATSKPVVYAERIIAHFGLTGYFESVCGAELDGTRSDKTELLRWVLVEHGIDAAEATMVGDRRHDIIGASNNGMRTVGVTYGYGSRAELEEAGAHRIVESPEALATALLTDLV